jgi:Ca2+-binding EF-hand superfamily protein
MPFFGTDEKQKRHIYAGTYEMTGEKWSNISEECKDFIRSLLEVDDQKRLSAQTALDHPWIAKSRAVSESSNHILESLRQYGRTSEFQRCCSQALAWSSSNDDQAKVRDQFLALNSSQNGSMTFAELRNAMFVKFPEMGETEFEKICCALDHNHDQAVHYSDFLAATMGSQISLTPEIRKTAFRRFDVDNSGLITVDDLRMSIGFCADGIAEGMIEEVTERGGNISFEQFSAYLKRMSLDSTLKRDAKVTIPNAKNTIVDKARLSKRRAFWMWLLWISA